MEMGEEGWRCVRSHHSRCQGRGRDGVGREGKLRDRTPPHIRTDGVFPYPRTLFSSLTLAPFHPSLFLNSLIQYFIPDFPLHLPLSSRPSFPVFSFVFLWFSCSFTYFLLFSHSFLRQLSCEPSFFILYSLSPFPPSLYHHSLLFLISTPSLLIKSFPPSVPNQHVPLLGLTFPFVIPFYSTLKVLSLSLLPWSLPASFLLLFLSLNIPSYQLRKNYCVIQIYRR